MRESCSLAAYGGERCCGVCCCLWLARRLPCFCHIWLAILTSPFLAGHSHHISSLSPLLCLQCDVDQFAPFAGMDVCGECQDGYAPVQGSSRCFAGFSGRVLVTEGLAMDGNTVYDPNGVIIKIYGDSSADVIANAVLGGANFTTDVAPGVAAFGGALDGE